MAQLDLSNSNPLPRVALVSVALAVVLFVILIEPWAVAGPKGNAGPKNLLCGGAASSRC